MERRVTSHTEEEEMNQRRDLLALARKGDQKAVSKLMELYQVKVYSGDSLKSMKNRKLPSRPTSPKHKESLPTAKKAERKPLSVVAQKPEPAQSKSPTTLKPIVSKKVQALKPKSKTAHSVIKKVVKTKTQTKSTVQATPKSKPTQMTKVKPKPKVIPKVKAKLKIKVKPKAKAKTQSKVQTKSASTFRAKAKAKPKPKSNVKAKRR